MQLGQVMNFGSPADRLADLQADELNDHELAADEGEGKGGHSRSHGAKRDIEEHVEADELIAEAVQIIHHGVEPRAGSWAANSSSTRSVRADRLPLTRTRSPVAALAARRSAAALAEATAVLLVRPDRLAASAMSAPPLPIAIR